MAKVIAVVSAYQPDASVVARVRANAEQVDALIVVDDGSRDSSALNALSSGPGQPAGAIELIRLPENVGIATALNVGIRSALEHGADFVLTLDQDTLLEPDYVTRAVATFAHTEPARRLGAVLPERSNDVPALATHRDAGLALVDEGIQSGMLTSAACIAEVGLLDERLFIDCVDIEWCLRIRDAGWLIALAPGCGIVHQIGERAPIRPFGLPLGRATANRSYEYHAPFRTYYIVRNNLDLELRNLRVRPRWVVRVMKRQLSTLAHSMTSGPHQLRHLLAAVTGAVHGLARRRGPIPAWLNRALGRR